MKLLIKILFFILAIFQTDICIAKVAVIDYVVSEISLSNIFNSEKNGTEIQVTFLEDDLSNTCKSESDLLYHKNLLSSSKAEAAKGGIAPKGWLTQASKKGGGTIFKDPSNPHNIIRQMPGNANSPNVLQQSPYVKFMKEGKFYDLNGKVLPNGNVPGAHIPLDQFNINNMPKF